MGKKNTITTADRVRNVAAAINENLASVIVDAGNNESILARLIRISVTVGKVAKVAKTIDSREAAKEARESKATERKATQIEKAEAQLKSIQEKLAKLKG